VSVRWSQLGTGARLFRIAHTVWGAFNLAGLAYLAWSAARRRRGKVASYGVQVPPPPDAGCRLISLKSGVP
jgi:hypothetical protein